MEFKMKISLFLSVIIFSVSSVNAKDITVNYDVKGMMCSMNCPDYVKEGAVKVDGVKKCEVDFNKGSAIITFDDSKVDQKELANILSKNTDGMYEINIVENESNQSWWDWIFGG